MEIRDSLAGQLHAAFRMLDNCIERCPDSLWISGQPPREFWKIAYHAVFYTHLYLGQDEAAFVRWAHHREKAEELWEEDAEPVEAFTRPEVQEYIRHVRNLIEPSLAIIDLDAGSGFSWYKNFNKLEHLLLNLRHLQGHVGQLSERLFAEGIESDWISRRS